MTQSEKRRFVFLVVLLLILVVAGVVIARFRTQGSASADVLGVIQNQAVATYKDGDGVDMDTTLSDISQLTVSSGVGNLTVNYSLGKRANQSVKLDLQLFKPSEDAPFTRVADKNGDAGSLVTKLKNIANGSYDVSLKPQDFLSQTVPNFPYQNGKSNIVDYKDAFRWGDIDVSHNNKGDNKINNADWAVFIKNWNTDNEKADYNGDSVINNADASVLLESWNKQGGRFVVDEVDAAAAIPEL